MATHHCYFFVFRTQIGEPIDWAEPTGGFVMATENAVHGQPIVNYGDALELIKRRYHCSHYETLRVMEVFEPDDCWTANLLHKAYEKDANEFEELMDCY